MVGWSCRLGSPGVEDPLIACSGAAIKENVSLARQGCSAWKA